MAVVIRLLDVPRVEFDTVERDALDSPLWVETYDPDARDGRGHVHFTGNPDRALRFDSMGEALEFYRRPSTVVPVRDDGKPNRPLTAYTLTFEKAP